MIVVDGEKPQSVRIEGPTAYKGLAARDGRVSGPESQTPARHLQASEYAELKALVKAQGLFEKQPLYYTFKFASALATLALSLMLLAAIRDVWLQVLNAALLAFAFVQISFIVHDIGHRQVFDNAHNRTLFGLFFCNLLIGGSQEWWVYKHNRHHSNPNQLDLDPDIDVPVIAFTKEQALSKRGLARFIVKYQAFLFFPLTALLALSPRNLSIRYMLAKRNTGALVEALCMGAHFVLFFGWVSYQFGLEQGLLFILVNQMLAGLYMGLVFASNHKGMPILEQDSPLDPLRKQVLTSRNIKSHPLTDFWYGGLNYQIEHHLFPSLPRNKLREAQAIVKAYCLEHSIPYHETSIFQSYYEILKYLHEVSAPLRADRKSKLLTKHSIILESDEETLWFKG